MKLDILFYSRQVTHKNIAFVRKPIASNPDKNRWVTSGKLFLQAGRTQQNRPIKDMTCRRFLSKLQSIGLITLPPRKRIPYGFSWTGNFLNLSTVINLNEVVSLRVNPLTRTICY